MTYSNLRTHDEDGQQLDPEEIATNLHERGYELNLSFDELVEKIRENQEWKRKEKEDRERNKHFGEE